MHIDLYGVEPLKFNNISSKVFMTKSYFMMVNDT
jgi:hypothetical protein